MSANKPNISQIRKYLNGELDARAMHELERQALDDPFLADALEGYGLKGDQQQQVADLQKRLQRRLQPTRKRTLLWPGLTIAASVLLFMAAGGWWLVNSRSSSVNKLSPADHAIVKAKPVIPALKAPVPAPDSAVLKPASPSNLTVAENRKGSVQQSRINDKYTPPPAAVAAEPPAQSSPARAEELRAGDAIAYSPQLAQRLVRDKAANANGLPGSSPDIRIRGVGSVVGKEPLYLVDGKIYNGKLSDLNPRDFKDVSTLKDASATAIYGSRAANGVILITTKAGSLARRKSDSSAWSKNMLADVVVSSSPVQQKKDLSSSVAGIAAVPIEQALQGRVAGVSVGRAKKVKASDTLKTITGQVLAKGDGKPLPGVIVTVAGKKEKTQTDANGRFKIRASGNDELNLGYLGFETKLLKANKQDSLKVTLKEDASALSEVVVVGYGASNTEREAETARPQNGWSEFNKYLKDNAKAINGKTGIVRLSFVVNADGSRSDFKILKSLSPEADKEAIKLVEEGPGWLANTNGQPQTVKLRIRFKK